MKKHLEKELGEHTAEMRGWHWALTSLLLIFGVGVKKIDYSKCAIAILLISLKNQVSKFAVIFDSYIFVRLSN